MLPTLLLLMRLGLIKLVSRNYEHFYEMVISSMFFDVLETSESESLDTAEVSPTT